MKFKLTQEGYNAKDLDIPYRIYEEFCWNIEEMAYEIIDLRKEIEER